MTDDSERQKKMKNRCERLETAAHLKLKVLS